MERASGFRGLIGAACEEITPPVGIYMKCWGAAKHDTAQGVHRPLTLTCITFQSSEKDQPLVLISADLMSWRSRPDEWAVRGAILEALQLDEPHLMFCLAHTHAAPSLRREESSRPGGHLIEPYQATLREATIRAARRALQNRKPAVLSWRYGKCDLATNRDFADPTSTRIVCGVAPDAAADDTLLVGRATDESGSLLATIVNYACHPTTLAWENTLLSPDWVGAMRETIESHTSAPCLFLQGASGELAPAEQYVGETALADRHGRRVGFAALATLEAMDPPGTRLVFRGVVESGAPLAIWRPAPAPLSSALDARMIHLDLPLKPMPLVAELESRWRECDDPVLKERLWRKRQVRRLVGEGETCRVGLWVWRIGDDFLVGHLNEAYSLLQTELRAQFADRSVAVINIVNGSVGYLPPRESFGKNLYQVEQTPFECGSLEVVIERAAETMKALL
jgi:hypothetical protein